jgi:hypothetical protein
MSKSNREEFWTSGHVAVGWAPPTNMSCAKFRWAVPTLLSSDQRISPHLKGVLPHPRGEIQSISPHHQISTVNQQTTCNDRVGRYSPNFAPREKEKNLQGTKSDAWPHHAKVRKTPWGSFEHLRRLPSENAWPRRKRACQIDDSPATARRQWRTLGRKRKASLGNTRLCVTARRQAFWRGLSWPAGNR